jgi:DNA-binding IclR family transcriptional regulator
MTVPVARRHSLSSVTKALLVLEHLVDAGEAGVSEIARDVGVTVGTAHRLVATLVETGFCEQNPVNRKYLPSRKLVMLAQRSRSTLNTREIAHYHLVQLVQLVDEAGNVAILSDGMALYTDKVISEQPFGIEVRVGSRLPAYCTALGKVLLAGLHDDEVSRYMVGQRSSRNRGEDHKPQSDSSFKAEIRRVREQGYALDVGEYLPDVSCVAAPISGADGRVVAAMSISAPRSRFQANHDRLVAETRRSADALSQSLSELGLPQTEYEFASTSLQ